MRKLSLVLLLVVASCQMPLRNAQAAEWRCTYYGYQSSCGWVQSLEEWQRQSGDAAAARADRDAYQAMDEMNRYYQRQQDDEERESRMKLMRKQLQQLD